MAGALLNSEGSNYAIIVLLKGVSVRVDKKQNDQSIIKRTCEL